jgi:LuxR family maltose regulon positive regulatory protein
MTVTASASSPPRPQGGPPPALVARRRRPRLSARLDVALQAATRLTLVSAPPGYGKSVAVAGWIADRALPAAWVSLDATAGDPSRLTREVLTAIGSIRPGATLLARAIAPGTAPDVRTMADLVVDAVATEDSDVVIVLDDCHLVDTPEATALVRRLVDRLPPFGHLVIVTREDPDLPLGRLRAHGALVEIRGDDLRFSAAEAATFLADAGVAPDGGLVDLLAARTEGWAAALQLAAITVRSSADPRAAAEAVSGTHRFLIDYLGDEVLAGLDHDLREVLPALSVADRFTAGLFAALTGRDDAAGLLDRAERANLFLSPMDADRRWFRMHGLFAGFLRMRLSADERRRLHAIAARWFDEAGLGREAVAHALEAGDAAVAARLVAREGRKAFEAGELHTVGRWIAALPAAARESDLDLVALEAWCRFYTGDLAGAAAIAERAVEWAEGHAAATSRDDAADTSDDQAAAQGRLLVLLALVWTTTRADAEAIARAGIERVGTDHLFRSLGLQAAGLAQLARGDVTRSLPTLRAAFDAAQAVGHPMAVLPASNPFAHALVAAGRRDEAEAVLRRVLEAYRGPGQEPLAMAWSARVALGIALLEGGDVVGARVELEGGLAAADALGVGREVLGWGLPSIALARQATGDARGALAILVRAPASSLSLPSLAGETEARIHLAQGDLARASRWADEAPTESPAGSPLLAILRASADTTVARVRLAEGRLTDARRALAEAGAAFEAWGTVPDRISTLILDAAASTAAGDRERALADLASAIRLAAPGGYVRRFVEDGRTLLPLLRELETVAPTFVRRVCDALREDAAPAGTVRRGTSILLTSDGELVESLTGRELDVLRRMATGASNAQLAEDLGVSAGTAKWHVAHILAKLGARSRTGAVIRGQDLGLI